MELNRRANSWAVCAVAALVSMRVSALSLGSVQGVAFVGQPLEVAVPVQFAADEDAAPHCFSAEVSYGDVPLASGRITVHVQPGPQPNAQLVRIRSSERVNEAVVTLTLLAVCGPKISRHYVLLSALPDGTDGAPSVAGAVAGTNPGAEMTSMAHRPPVSNPQGAQKISRVAADTSSAGSAYADRAVASPIARLEKALAPVDAKRRADAIGTGPTDQDNGEALRKRDAHTEALEADIKQLQMASASDQKKLQALAAALERSLSGGDNRTPFYALGGLLLACLAVIVYALRAKFLAARTHPIPPVTQVPAPNADIDLDLGWNLDFGSGADAFNEKKPKA